MSDTRPSAELAARLQAALSLLPGGAHPALPPAAPAPGQGRDEWLAIVAAARVAHDAAADWISEYIAHEGPEVAAVRDVDIQVTDGSITARVYKPHGDGPFPAVAFYHGGAFWFAGGEGGFGLTDGFCRRFCAGLGAVVVNIDYRLAPEYPYPAQLEDSYAGLAWLVNHAEQLVIDLDNVSVMGSSSGGNQAAAVCLLARERGGPQVTAQVLHVPALDLTLSSSSVRADEGLVSEMGVIRRLYATPTGWRHPLVSPLLADDLRGLPPAVIVTGEHDNVRDDGRRYALRLAEYGVEVVHLEYPMMHNIALPETSERMFEDMIAALKARQSPVHALSPQAPQPRQWRQA